MALSAVLLALTAPLSVGASLFILATMGRPVLYKSRRMGKDGVLFTMFKFRSMAAPADAGGPGITGSQDSRITPTGRVLRNWKLDELPQLWNVLRGEMSLVGPRPEDPRYLPWYAPEQLRVLSVRPGITGRTQLQFRHEERLLNASDVEEQYRTELLPRKLDLDLEYVDSRSLPGDLMLLWRTAAAVVATESRQDIEEKVATPR